MARIVNQPALSWTNGTEKEVLAYEARVFELYGSDGEVIRAIYCINDGGRWVHEGFGTPHPNETTFAKSAPRKKNRFTAQDLASLVGAYGFPILDEGVLRRTAEFTLLRQKYKEPRDSNIQARLCTLEEADDPA